MLLFLAMYLKNMLHFYKTAQNASDKTNEKTNKIIEDWRQFFRIKRPVSLVSSQVYLSPFTKGMVRPIIFIPEKIISIKDNDDFISSIIGHEMSHIKRWDNLWLKLQSLLQIVYFFNPLV